MESKQLEDQTLHIQKTTLQEKTENDVSESAQMLEEKDESNENHEDNAIRIHKCYNINMGMIPAKMVFLTDSAKRIGYAPFMVAFFISLGLNKAEAGIIAGFRLIGSIVGGPFWGLIADKKQAHRGIFCVLIIFSSFFMCSQVLLSIPLANKAMNRCPTLYPLNGNDTMNSTRHQDVDASYQSSDRKKLFFLLLAVNILACFFEGSILSFVDFAVLRKIQLSVNRKVEYGKQRMFSTGGAAIAVVVSNVFVDNFPAANITCFSAVFVLYVMWSLLCVFFSLFLFRGIKCTPKLEDQDNDRGKQRKEESLRKLLKETCLKADTLLFFVSAFIAGSLYAVYRSFIYVYLKELNVSTTLLTVILVMPYICSPLVLFFDEFIIKILGGSWQGIACSFGFFCVRFFSISFVKDPWLALLSEATHGLTFPLFVLTSIRRVRTISPASILTTMCAIVNMLTYSVGYVAGSSIGGIVYEEFGGRILYRMSGILSGVVCVVICVYILWLKKEERKSSANEALEETS